jgi:hypothetical protein
MHGCYVVLLPQQLGWRNILPAFHLLLHSAPLTGFGALFPKTPFHACNTPLPLRTLPQVWIPCVLQFEWT